MADAIPENKWNAIEDFKWIKKRASPHFQTIDASAQRHYFDVLEDVVEKAMANGPKSGDSWEEIVSQLKFASESLSA